jgi:signal transduction histidine kinase
MLLANRNMICAAIIAAMVISGLLAAACVVLYVMAAGHDKDKEGISETILDRMPMGVSAFVFLMTAFFPLCVVEEIHDYESIIYYAFLAIALVIMFVSAFLWLGTVAVNVKRGRFWENTLIYKLFIKGMIRFGKEFRFVFKNLKMGVRVWLIFAAVTFAEMFFLAWFDVEGGFILLWLIEKVLIVILIHKLLKQFAVLKNTALSIAAGDVTEPVDTSKMLIDLEEQGNALNIIRTGMNEAMDARIKSERLKTELITNVSHDIKTPLTSIINYVDLMQKEKPENEKIKEYLEVLDRQSGKLKKLIEDLIEASKAATGNIKMQMEDVNARVLLNQSIGEFEERLEQKNIKLVTEVPEEDIHIQADSRYLWRVLDNLMNNIVKYSQEGTRAYVDLKKLDGHVRFVFRNTSRDELNISADELMERFVRGDASRNSDGNGLGLSIASSLTEAMGGKLTISIDGDLFKATVEF